MAKRKKDTMEFRFYELPQGESAPVSYTHLMATRTLPSERDRRMTILLTPFMSCSAKLPIYAFFV